MAGLDRGDDHLLFFDNEDADDIFCLFDKSDNRRISKAEFMATLRRLGPTFPEEDEELFRAIADGRDYICPPDLRRKEVLRRLQDRMDLGVALCLPRRPGEDVTWIDRRASFDENLERIEAHCEPMLRELKQRIGPHSRPITDTYVSVTSGDDHELHPLVDLVMEGGGTLGIGLVGFAWALEMAGVRFRSVAGASAGAINACFLAATDGIAKPRADKAKDALNQDFAEQFIRNSPAMKGDVQPVHEFLRDMFGINYAYTLLARFGSWWLLDGSLSAKEVLRDLPEGPMDAIFSGDWERFHQFARENSLDVYTLLQVLRTQLGLYDAKGFEDWLHGELSSVGAVTTTDELLSKDRPQLKLTRDQLTFIRDGDHSVAPSPGYMDFLLRPELIMVTSEVATGSRVLFPRHAPAFFSKGENVNLATMVRASMSVPLFFQPLVVNDIPHYDPDRPVSARQLAQQQPDDEAARTWSGGRESLNYNGAIPSQAIFMDGGLLSNFPLDVFHFPSDEVWLPSVGVRLGSAYVQPPTEEPSLPGLVGSMVNTMRRNGDARFLARNQAERRLVSEVQIPRFVDSQWLSFTLNDEAKSILYLAGVRAAIRFLDRFDWNHYKVVRHHMRAGERALETHSGRARATLVSPLEPEHPMTGSTYLKAFQQFMEP